MSPQIATNATVSRDELLDFIRPRHQAIMMTARADGRPQASPVTCGVDAEGRIVVSTYPERAKARNARRDPHVTVLVLSDDFGGPWVQVDGDAEVIDMPAAADALVDYYRAIAGEHPDWDEYRQAMIRQDKSLLRITPTSWGPVATGGFPARLAWRAGRALTVAVSSAGVEAAAGHAVTCGPGVEALSGRRANGAGCMRLRLWGAWLPGPRAGPSALLTTGIAS